MRTARYIGLTRAAMDFLADYQKVKAVSTKNYTHGMFPEEKIWLGEWEDKNSIRKFAYIKEVLQDSPWSSGPMLFTCLYGYFHNDPEHNNAIAMFQWVVSPRQQNEYDVEKGTYWV